MARRTNQRGVNLLKNSEGWRNRWYKDPIGVWTCCYGHTPAAGQPVKVDLKRRFTRVEGEAILHADLRKFEIGVEAALSNHATDNQFSAFVVFAYNVGLAAFRSSSALRAHNAGRYSEVPRLLGFWVKAKGKTLPGLVARREAEGELYSTPEFAQHDPEDENVIRIQPAADGLPQPDSGTSTEKWVAAGSAAGGFGYAVSSFSMTDWRVIAVLTGGVILITILAFLAMGYERRERLFDKLFGRS